MGVGTVHHVAYKAEDTDEQEHWREQLSERGLRVTDVIDRVYFNSIYFREPGGVLFEIARLVLASLSIRAKTNSVRTSRFRSG